MQTTLDGGISAAPQLMASEGLMKTAKDMFNQDESHAAFNAWIDSLSNGEQCLIARHPNCIGDMAEEIAKIFDEQCRMENTEGGVTFGMTDNVTGEVQWDHTTGESVAGGATAGCSSLYELG